LIKQASFIAQKMCYFEQPNAVLKMSNIKNKFKPFLIYEKNLKRKHLMVWKRACECK